MATFDGAVIKEQGVTFAIVVVKRSTLSSSIRINEARESFQQFFPGIPIINGTKFKWNSNLPRKKRHCKIFS